MNRWTFKMAWRDSRPNRKRLFLFVTSILLGIAAIISIGSFGVNLNQAIDNESKTLLGADLLFASTQPFPAEIEAIADSIRGAQAREYLFSSMAFFPKNEATRLVQVRAVAGAYPFYGAMETEPMSAAQTYQSDRFALVDQTLLLQYDAQPGDTIQIGQTSFQVAGKILKIPNQPSISSSLSPRVYLPAKYLDEMNVLERGSRVTRHIYFKMTGEDAPKTIAATYKSLFEKHLIRVETVETRKERISATLDDLYRFLNLVGFVALVLGSVGIASSVHVYAKQKASDVAVLRCLGATAGAAFSVYLLQVIAMTAIGSILGALLGVLVQVALPMILADFLPVPVKPFLVWTEIFKGATVGFIISILFALLPMAGVRKVSPLGAIRAEYEQANPIYRDRARILIFIAIALSVTGYAILQTADFQQGLYFSGGLLLAFLALAGVAKTLTYSARRFFPAAWPYIWRQGLSNLFRPNNQTLALMVVIGLGAFLITTLYLTHETLLGKVTFMAEDNRPNLLLYDIQPDQKEAVGKMIREHGLPILQEAAMVTMRPQQVVGEEVEDILQDSTQLERHRILKWEFRATYRDSLFDSEKILRGEWIGKIHDPNVTVFPVSMEESAVKMFAIELGDTLVWNVQGTPVKSWLASVRKVDWQRIQANFMVVFPVGVLDDAPQIFIAATRVNSTEISAKLQREVVKAFPNVSIIDIELVLQTIDTLLGNVAFAIRFMAMFSIFTGLVVLVSAVIMSRFQRIEESVLLRTLGASRRQVRQIMLIEYFFMGGFSALAGLALAYFCGWALAYFVFDAVFVPGLMPFLAVSLVIVLLTLLIGTLNSRGMLDRPPLEVLRAEGR